MPIDKFELGKERFKLLIFNSLFGRYQFLRMPYGVHSASDVCQQKIVQIIDGTDVAADYQDNIIIWESTQQELIRQPYNKSVLIQLRKMD